MSLLVSGVFWDEVKVFSADDESSVHLGGDNGTGKNTATDGNETCEWALLVYEVIKSVLVFMIPPYPNAIASLYPSPSFCLYLFLPNPIPSNRVLSRLIAEMRDRRTDVVTLDGGLWCAETQSNVLVPSASSFANSRRLDLRLGVQEDVWLLLVSPLGLDGQFGCHDCVVVVRSQFEFCQGGSMFEKWLASFEISECCCGTRD